MEKEQEYQVNKLMRKIERLERDTITKQTTLEQVRYKHWNKLYSNMKDIKMT